MVKISAQSDVVYWSYCHKSLPPPSPKMGPIGPWTKKMYLFLLSKVENGKYPESETQPPESLDGWSYYRQCENFWWPFGTVSGGGGNLDPIWPPKKVFFLNFTRIMWYFWGLRLTLFDIYKDVVAEMLVFSNPFGFAVVNWVPFGCVPFESKFKTLKDFSSTTLFLLATTSGQNFSRIEQYFGK